MRQEHEPRAAACPLATSQMMTELELLLSSGVSGLPGGDAELALHVTESNQMLEGEKISSCRQMAVNMISHMHVLVRLTGHHVCVQAHAGQHILAIAWATVLILLSVLAFRSAIGQPK